MQSEDVAALRALAREFCDREVRPGARERDRGEEFPAELVHRLAEVGFLGLTAPAEYGGQEADPFSYAAVMEELGAADSAVRSLVSVTAGLVVGSIVRWGDESQRRAWVPRIVAGEVAAFGLTEPEAGSNPAQLRTTAVRRGDGWVVTGAKTFITNGSRGCLTLVFARAVVDGEDRGITCFLVPQDAAGYRTTPIGGKLGIRASDTAAVHLDGVEVGPQSVLGEVGRGMQVALSALDNGRFSLAAAAVGVAREALDASVAYALERHQFGRAIASHQLVQELLADMHVDVAAARGLVHQVAAKKAAGERFTTEASVAKLFATEAAVRCADRAVQVHGGYGYVDDYPVQRLLRDARVTTLYEGTSQIQRLLIGKALTGCSAFHAGAPA